MYNIIIKNKTDLQIATLPLEKKRKMNGFEADLLILTIFSQN